MDWFKFYTEARNDRKILSLSMEQRWVWVSLLCFASEQPERGVIEGYDSELLAIEVADGNTDLLNETVSRLCKLRILSLAEDGTISFLQYKKRQARKPSDEPEATAARKAAQRERDKAVIGSDTAKVTPMSRPVTPLELDKELEREQEQHPAGAPESAVEADNQSRLAIFPSQPTQPGQELPPDKQAEVELRRLIEEHAATLFVKSALNKAQRGVISDWFARHKQGLTEQIVAYAGEETAMHTGGEGLAYFFTVMENCVRDPGRPKRQGNHAATNARSRAAPVDTHIEEKSDAVLDERRGWAEAAKRDKAASVRGRTA